jgi:hypothetical protein
MHDGRPVFIESITEQMLQTLLRSDETFLSSISTKTSVRSIEPQSINITAPGIINVFGQMAVCSPCIIDTLQAVCVQKAPFWLKYDARLRKWLPPVDLRRLGQAFNYADFRDGIMLGDSLILAQFFFKDNHDITDYDSMYVNWLADLNSGNMHGLIAADSFNRRAHLAYNCLASHVALIGAHLCSVQSNSNCLHDITTGRIISLVHGQFIDNCEGLPALSHNDTSSSVYAHDTMLSLMNNPPIKCQVKGLFEWAPGVAGVDYVISTGRYLELVSVDKGTFLGEICLSDPSIGIVKHLTKTFRTATERGNMVTIVTFNDTDGIVLKRFMKYGAE